MPLLHLVLLAVVQGVTEFLPISSSGHLVLVPVLTGLPDQGPLLDVAVHVGTLVAVMLYLRREVAAMALAVVTGGRREGAIAGGALLGYLVLATVPVMIAGGLMYWSGASARLRGPEVVAWTTLIFGLVLYAADRLGMTVKRLEHLGAGAALGIGLAQVLALVPGTSRAGITITAARLMGFERRDAARFSMLLSIPTIIAAGTLSAIEIYRAGDLQLGIDAAVAVVLSCIAALAAISLMMAWLNRATFTPFVVYRLVLGLALLAWLYY